MGLIQLIKDFRKWRQEKYRDKLEAVCKIEAVTENPCQDEVYKCAFAYGIAYGIEHRKEILKKEKI